MKKEKTELEIKYAHAKKELGLKDASVASLFGYASVASFRNAARKEKVMAGFVATYEKTKEVCS